MFEQKSKNLQYCEKKPAKFVENTDFLLKNFMIISKFSRKPTLKIPIIVQRKRYFNLLQIFDPF